MMTRCSRLGAIILAVVLIVGVPQIAAATRVVQDREHAITPLDATVAAGPQTAFQAVNRENAFAARLTGSALRISSAFRAGAPWSIDLTVRAFGIDGGAPPLGVPAVSSDGFRVIDRYAGLTRSVAQSAAGLDQEFEIAVGLAGDQRKESQVVQFGLIYPTALKSELGKSDRSLRFLDEGGELALAFSIVTAIDAEGTVIPAHLELTTAPRSLMRSLELVVEGAGAAYPVRVTLRAARIEAALPEEARPPIKKVAPASEEAANGTTAVLVAPPNDTCGGAEPIPGAGPFPWLTAVTADITDATTAGDPSPLAGCPIGTPSPSRGIWYTFTPNTSGAYTISTCADAPTGSTVDDTLLDVYTSSTGTCAGVMTAIACDDDACAAEGLQSVVTTNLTAGTPYFIVVHKWDNVAPTAGNTAIQLRVTPAVTPANDLCSGAVPLTLNIPQAGTTLAATADYTLSGGACFALPSPPSPLAQTVATAIGRDVAYSFTPTAASGSYSFRVKHGVAGPNAMLYVTNSCPAPGAIATPPCIGAANRRASAVPVGEEVMCLPITGGTTVYAFVDESTATGGSAFTIEVTSCTRETEPNDTPPTANNLAGVCGIEGSTSPANNADFFSLGNVQPSSRIFAFADNTANNTGDYALRVTTQIDTFEFDDDDGDASFGQGGFEPVIAGTNFTPGGPAYLRLSPFSTTLLSEPYRLYHVEQPPSSAAVPETEPNDPPNTNGAPANYFSGVTGTTDQDDFSFSAAAGDLIYVSVDNDPDMDGVATDTTLGLFDPVGTLVSQVNGSTAVSSNRAPVPGLLGTTPVAPGEALVYRAPIAGVYTAAILGVAAGPGNYLMSISKNCNVGGGGLNTTYTFPSIATIVVQPLPPFFPGAPPQIIRLRQNGPDTSVSHGLESGGVIPGELLSLDLQGATPLLGNVVLRESPTRQSLGHTNVVSPTQFNSFFDVFVTIDLNLGAMHLFNDQPIHVQGTHSTQPPHDTHMETPVQSNVYLYDENDPPPFGAPRAQILYVDHQVNPKFPPPATDDKDTSFTGTIQLFPPFPSYTNSLFASGGTLVRRGPPCLGCGPGGGDTIPTEMLSLSLTGNDPVIGSFQIGLNHDAGYPITSGRVTGQPTRSYPADAFFDVFFDVNTSSIGRLVTRPDPSGPAHVEASTALGNPIGTVPCGTGQDLRQPSGQQTLLYQPGNLATPVGAITNIVHRVDVPKTGEPPPQRGKDCFDSRITARITLFPPFHPVGCTEDLILNGPFKVWRGDAIDPGNGQDLINTIMACYRFTGTSSGASCGLGGLIAHPSSTNPSVGQIQSLAPTEMFPANSFFDIFTEIETGIGTVHTNDPTHMQTTIRTVPPGAGEIYFGPGTTIPLYNAANVQIGTFEVISHELINSIVCPCVCEPQIYWRADKTTLEVGIPLGGAGVQYDVAQGSLATNSPNWPSSFFAVEAWALEGPFTYQWSGTPLPGRLQWFLSRDGAFSQANGTLNSCPQTRQLGDRDLEVSP